LLKSAEKYAFADFVLDRRERVLTRSGEPVELNARYFDALRLMVDHAGQLVTKERFMDAVWRGVPVTDEALTQCVRTLRRALGDEASRPRFIETVPKHGYRFIADVRVDEAAKPRNANGPARMFAALASAGTIGGGLAGLIGGALYGVAAASIGDGREVGGMSLLLVLMCVTIAVAVIGSAGVSLGIAGAFLSDRARLLRFVGGGALGGLMVGLIAKLIMIDSFRILFGQSPGDITGALEGLILGGAVGLGAWVAARSTSLRRAAAVAAACGAAGGLLIALLGRPLMAGSLARLAQHLPSSRLSLDAIANLVGEGRFGPLAGAATATLEGALFAAAIVLAMRLMERQAQP
jgi:DNA-binding winged helix-turn-helix (wHTH) protein